MAGEHEARRNKAATRGEQPANDRRFDRERRVGHDVEGPAGEPEITGVRPHDSHRRPVEAAAEPRDPIGVQFDRDDPRARRHECRRQCTGARTDVEDELAAPDARVGDELSSPGISELMPSPPRPQFRGHDAP